MHVRHRAQKYAEIGLTQIMAGVHAHADALRGECGDDKGRQRALRMSRRVRFGIGAGVQLDTIRAAICSRVHRGVCCVRFERIGEDAHAAAERFEFRDVRAQGLMIADEVETMIGGELAVAVGHESRLCRPHGVAQRGEAGIAKARRCEWIAFEVELHAVSARQLGQRIDIVGADMPRVRPRMHGDAVRASIQTGARSRYHIGIAAAARIAQHGDLIDVDAEDGHEMRRRIGIDNSIGSDMCRIDEVLLVEERPVERKRVETMLNGIAFTGITSAAIRPRLRPSYHLQRRN
jgi:hypothetical protein